MIDHLIISLIAIGLISLISVIIAFRQTKWTLVILIPITALFATLGSFSYDDLLGYPINRSWEEMPEEFIVIFFQIEGKNNIVLWVSEGNNTRLIRLPYVEMAEKALQESRKEMAKGKMVKFSSNGDKIEGSSSNGKEGQGDEDSINGWRYKVVPLGNNAIKGKLPPK